MTQYDPIHTHAQPAEYGNGFTILREEIPGQEALFAQQLVEHWGMVAGTIDGEDTAGRAILRPATPEEVVERAIRCTELLFSRTREMGWFTTIPLPTT